MKIYHKQAIERYQMLNFIFCQRMAGSKMDVSLFTKRLSDLGAQLKLRRSTRRWSAAHEALADRQNARLRRLGEHGLEIADSSQRARTLGDELLLSR